MKRTKETFFQSKPNFTETKGSSGLTHLLGEDKAYFSRNKELQEIQKHYLDEQVKEKQLRRQFERNEQTMSDQQTLALNRMRGKLETEKRNREIEMEKACDLTNIELAEERRTRERLEKEREIEEEKRELELLNQRRVKRVLPQNR